MNFEANTGCVGEGVGCMVGVGEVCEDSHKC